MEGDGRTLFLVGDPQQSIYRFRKAEVGLFIRAATKGIGSIKLKTLILSSNFRCQKNLSEWINPLFSHLFPKKNEMNTGAITYTPSVAISPFKAQVEGVISLVGED